MGNKKNMNMTRGKAKDFGKMLAVLLAGNTMLAFMVAVFVIPNDLVMGGATGIGLVLSKIIHVDTAVIVFVLNMAMLALGRIVLGKKFFYSTIASSLLYPVLLALVQRIPGIGGLTDDKLLSAILGGLILGVGLGIVMRVGASTGGIDAWNLCLHKWFHYPVSVFVYLTDTVIILWQAYYVGVENAMYGVLLLVVETLVLNQTMLMGKAQIQIFVISERHEEICRRILSELNAGATMILMETGLLRKAQKGVMCVIPPQRLFAAKQMIHEIDPDAFLTITQIKEVGGQGFTQERIKLPIDEQN